MQKFFTSAPAATRALTSSSTTKAFSVPRLRVRSEIGSMVDLLSIGRHRRHARLRLGREPRKRPRWLLWGLPGCDPEPVGTRGDVLGAQAERIDQLPWRTRFSKTVVDADQLDAARDSELRHRREHAVP